MLGVIVESSLDPARNLAYDEALLRAVPTQPVLRVWSTSASVVLGRFQEICQTADLVACARDGVPVLRRPTGGAAAFIDPGTINLTLVAAAPARPFPLTDLVRDVLAHLGLPAVARGARVWVGGACVAVAARLRTCDAVLTHLSLPVTTPRCLQRGYLVGGAPPHALAEYGRGLSVPRVRELILAGATHRAEITYARRLDAAEAWWRDWLYALRYADPRWHLVGEGCQPLPPRPRSGWRG